MILVVNTQSNDAQIVHATSFVNEGVWERNHIQDWVRKNPALLGEPLLILTIEFDRFEGSKDRLDALALDKRGNLIIIEFKRTSDGGMADLQAIRYASMVSATRLEQLVPYYVDYLRKYCGEEIDSDFALERMVEFVEDPDFTELSNRPRIMLCAQDFGPELTTSVLWLREFGIDITCIRITPHKTDGTLVVVPTRIIPLTEAEAYMVNVRQKEESRQTEGQTRKELTFPFLLRENIIKAGDTLFLRANLPDYVAFKSGDPTYEAEVTGHTGRSKALRWKKDGKLYSSSALARSIFSSLKPENRRLGGINGSTHWTLSDGRHLWEIDQDLRRKM